MMSGILSVLLADNSAPAAPTTTWNSADKAGGVTLSNGALTATATDDFAGVRAVASSSSGKRYWEIHVDTVTALLNLSVGFGDSSASLASVPGFDTHGVSWTFDNHIYLNASVLANVDPWNQGDTLCIALDISNNLAWFRVNGANWNNNVTHNPATNVGGIDISGRAAGALFAMVTSGRFGTSDVFTANFGGTAYAQTVPSGFGNW